MSKNQYWTDYPILELGDVSGRQAPIRECRVLSYDGDRYCDVEVGGVVTNFKRGYIYHVRQRLGSGPYTLSHNLATRLYGGQNDHTG